MLLTHGYCTLCLRSTTLKFVSVCFSFSPINFAISIRQFTIIYVCICSYIRTFVWVTNTRERLVNWQCWICCYQRVAWKKSIVSLYIRGTRVNALLNAIKSIMRTDTWLSHNSQKRRDWKTKIEIIFSSYVIYLHTSYMASVVILRCSGQHKSDEWSIHSFYINHNMIILQKKKENYRRYTFYYLLLTDESSHTRIIKWRYNGENPRGYSPNDMVITDNSVIFRRNLPIWTRDKDWNAWYSIEIRMYASESAAFSFVFIMSFRRGYTIHTTTSRPWLSSHLFLRYIIVTAERSVKSSSRRVVIYVVSER